MSVRVLETPIRGLYVVEPVRRGDGRGYLVETYKLGPYSDAGVVGSFVQDNLSHSTKGVLRGLHFQKGQAKLVTVVRGEIFDVAVDIRPGSSSFGRYFGTILSGENHRQLFMPVGFAHGFCVVSEFADVWYKMTDIYRPEEEGGIRWDDPDIGVDWPISNPLVSERDRKHPHLKEISALDLAVEP
ncbi:MAG TPA: dTDP-4-dehydrorhamnose 3,5-epimerase [Vicinamibacteria bacterium]|nr:dTDP-4-dehydrorhamnose 3,5-epimerase [Vicinamibacteria bacterium]